MRRDRRFQLLFNRDRVALILDCLEQARRTFSASGEKSEEELAEIEKMEHSFRQVLAYDETFKEIFKGGGQMSIIQAVAFPSAPSLVRCVEDEGDGFFTTSYWLNGASLCSVSGSLFPDKGEQPTVFFFTEKMVGPEVDEAFAAVTFDLFGKSFTIEEAKEYSLTGKPVKVNKRTAIFQCMPF